MSTADRNTRNGRTPSRWNRIRHSFVEWRRRARSRDELMGLSERTLRDIGVTRCDCASEASKPFWMV
jgi:uncharacterized protein YjiS (DUF1127 family)